MLFTCTRKHNGLFPLASSCKQLSTVDGKTFDLEEIECNIEMYCSVTFLVIYSSQNLFKDIHIMQQYSGKTCSVMTWWSTASICCFLHVIRITNLFLNGSLLPCKPVIAHKKLGTYGQYLSGRLTRRSQNALWAQDVEIY